MKRMNKAQTERLQARLSLAAARIDRYRKSLGPHPGLSAEDQARIFLDHAPTDDVIQIVAKVVGGGSVWGEADLVKACPQVAKERAKREKLAKAYDAQLASYTAQVRREESDLLDRLIFNGDAEEILGTIAKFEKKS